MKKGVLFTASLVIMVSLVLAIAILNFKTNETNKERLAELGSLERLYSLSNSIESGSKEIFNAYSGFNISINDEEIVFQENLPNNNADLFKNNMEKYKNYIESKDNNIKLNIDNLKNELSLIIYPHNIIYKHNSFGGNKIIINPSEINFNKYYVEIERNFSISSCQWNTFPGNLNFELKINQPNCDSQRQIDPNKDNLITINNNLFIKINKNLEIENNLDKIKVKTIITLNEIPNERTIVSSDKIISINYQDLNISKNTGFRII